MSWPRWAAWAAGGVAGPLGVVVMLVPLVAVGGPPPAAVPGGGAGLDPVLFDAYVTADGLSPRLGPGCDVRWSVLAGIGQVESGSLAGRTVDPDGRVSPPVVGVALDGSGGNAAIADSDGGALDGDTRWDRAVGPLQFIPSSWRLYGQDADADGVADPQNVYDAALAAAAHLCRSAPGDYTDPAQLAAALLAYNASSAYVARVLAEAARFDALGEMTQVGPASGAPAAGGYALPLDRRWFETHPAWLTKPHHDYPAADLPVPVGTPVYAAAAGTVRTATAASSRCGFGLVVAGADGFDYVYCHASALLVGGGQNVVPGQAVARSGSTGNSSGPHLHFGVQRSDGTRLCPQGLLSAWFSGAPASPASAGTSGCSY